MALRTDWVTDEQVTPAVMNQIGTEVNAKAVAADLGYIDGSLESGETPAAAGFSAMAIGANSQALAYSASFGVWAYSENGGQAFGRGAQAIIADHITIGVATNTVDIPGALNNPTVNGKAAAVHNHAWSEITSGVPTTFPPTIGAGAAQAVAGNDPRLTDARTPTTHNHSWSQITSGVPATFPPTIGATASTAVAGNDPRLTDARTPVAHNHTAAEISNASATGRSILTAADLAAVKTFLAYAKADVGLGNVDNTSDATKNAAVATLTNKTLGATSATGDITIKAGKSLALENPSGNSTTYLYNNGGTGASNLQMDVPLYLNGPGTAANSAVTTTATQTLTNKTLTAPAISSPAITGTPTGLTKTHVGLANVDNTTDALKPVSTATQTALNLKNDTQLVSEFYPSASPSVLHNTDVYIVMNTTGLNDGLAITRTGVTADLVIAKAGVWRFEARTKWAYFASAEIKLCWILADGLRIAYNDTTTRDGWISCCGTVALTVGKIVKLGTFQYTGGTRLIDPGLWNCGITATWIKP